MSEVLDRLPLPSSPAQVREQARADWLGAQATHPADEQLDETGAWQERSGCLDSDPELFFPEKGDKKRMEAAKQICRMCDVRTQCLNEALVKQFDHGIWGGLTERERRAIKRLR